MIPTPRLRFVNRKYKVPSALDMFGAPAYHTVRILQQWWETGMVDEPVGEWRDVPLEDETP